LRHNLHNQSIIIKYDSSLKINDNAEAIVCENLAKLSTSQKAARISASLLYQCSKHHLFLISGKSYDEVINEKGIEKFNTRI
jgi:hypothetical protein